MIFFLFFSSSSELHFELSLPLYTRLSYIHIDLFKKIMIFFLFFLDASSPKANKKINDFYQTSLSPVKRLLNESIDSNIEIIQMDEQECILEIVDGVLTIVPKDKSTSSSIVSNGEQENNNYSKRIFE